MSDHIPTLADLCFAIAEGQLSADIEGDMYRINALELRRYFNKSWPLPSTSRPPLSRNNTNPWPSSSQISVA
jgi:hypothetical protein